MGLFRGKAEGPVKHWEAYYRAVQRQEWQKALAALEELRKKDAGDPKILLKIADLLQRTPDRRGAVSAYKQAAVSLLRAGFSRKALAIYKIILRLEPGDGEALEKSREILREVETAPGQPGIPPVPAQGQDMQETEEAVEKAPHAPPPDSTSPAPGAVSPVPQVFSFLGSDEWQGLVDRASRRAFRHGEVALKEGDTGDSIFVIMSGSANVLSSIIGETVRLATLSGGDVFGEVAFLTGRPRTASVVAEGPLEVVEIGRELLEETIERNPLVLDSLVDFYHSRVQNTISKIKER